MKTKPLQIQNNARFTRMDKLLCSGLTLVYAVIALLNLGSLQAPVTEYQAEPSSELVEIDLGQEVYLSEFWVFGGIAEGGATIEGGGTEIRYEQAFDEMFRWQRVEMDAAAQNITLRVDHGKLNLREMVFIDQAGQKVFPTHVSENGTALFDEPEEVPEAPSYLNGMYFDELYHARTAYEHLNGIDPYENSHPPLGKVFIMLGISVFGMNAFGWRIVGALFGIGMVPILYAFAKRLLKRTDFALLSAVLFTFDFMHFTQTRIATIDVYAVFFILLMYYYMHEYYCMNFYKDGLKATLRPLALGGVFFALGAASKWICIYAGAGLAVLLFLSLGQRYIEYRRARKADTAGPESKFFAYTIQTLLFCCVFYIAVPVAVYLAAYTPYYLSEKQYGLKDVWEYQKFMWTYHSTLDATHPYQSAWWQWPFTLRPMWYYLSDSTPKDQLSTLTVSGNPAVWWVCSVGTVWLMLRRLNMHLHSIRENSPAVTVLLTGVAVNFLPWVLVSRCTFIYHFFATVPFVILCAVLLLHDKECERPNLKWVKWVWMALAVLLFVLLYPGISGLEVPMWWARILRFVPGGGLMYGA